MLILKINQQNPGQRSKQRLNLGQSCKIHDFLLYLIFQANCYTLYLASAVIYSVSSGVCNLCCQPYLNHLGFFFVFVCFKAFFSVCDSLVLYGYQREACQQLGDAEMKVSILRWGVCSECHLLGGSNYQRQYWLLLGSLRRLWGFQNTC